MVSSMNPAPSQIDSPVRHDRGFVVVEEGMISAEPGMMQSPMAYRSRHFWGPVIAGALFALSLFVLSATLMFGCHVGVTSAGAIMLGGGAAVWMVVTACIAYFIGGMIAGSTTPSRMSGWLRGAALWGLSIPLAMAICGLASAGTSMWFPATTHWIAGTQNFAGEAMVSFGFMWSAFFTLLGGLIFALAGSTVKTSRREENLSSR